MNVVLADDHQPFRDGMRALLTATGRVRIVAEAADGEQAVRAALAHRPDLVLMDLRMPRVDGIAATRRIGTLLPATRVLVLTTFDDDGLVRAAVEAGAAGYLLKAMPPDDLVAVMELTLRGYATFAGGVAARVRDAGDFDPRIARVLARISRLSPREREVLGLLGEGRTNGEIALTLSLALGTVKNIVSAVLASLGVRHRTEAAIVARLAVRTEDDRVGG